MKISDRFDLIIEINSSAYLCMYVHLILIFLPFYFQLATERRKIKVFEKLF